MILKNNAEAIALTKHHPLTVMDGQAVLAFCESDWLSVFIKESISSLSQVRTYFDDIIEKNIKDGLFKAPRYDVEYRSCGIRREYARHFGVLTDAVYGLIYAQKTQQFLLQRRSDDGLWDFSFGGAHCWRDAQTLQTLEDSLYQESQEEVGIDPDDLDIFHIDDLSTVTTLILGHVAVSYEMHHRRVITIKDVDVRQTITDDEALGSHWFSVDEVLDLAKKSRITPKIQYLLLTAINEIQSIETSYFIAENEQQFHYYQMGDKTDFQSFGTLEDILFR